MSTGKASTPPPAQQKDTTTPTATTESTTKPAPANQPTKHNIRRVGLLTAGGLAPCLSSAVGGLIERYTEVAPDIEIIAYRCGYRGVLVADRFAVGHTERQAAPLLHLRGGSPLGNSRVKLSNIKDCEQRGFVKKGEDPRKVAADQLVRDRIDVLHTIGGDDTNIAAADLSDYLKKNNYSLTVIGLPKTIDNDVFPIVQTLGAHTAAAEGAKFFRNVVSDHSATSRSLIVHEIMGRTCGWLTAATARRYMELLDQEQFAPVLNLSRAEFDVHAVFIPEIPFDVWAETKRLKKIMDSVGNVNIFVAEGAGAEAIAAELRAQGKKVPVDAFGHIKLDSINVGEWIGKKLAPGIGAKKMEVQKSGYYSRAAPANNEDLSLIKACVDTAVEAALAPVPISGVVGHDEDQGGRLRAIEFSRIKGGKPFDINTPWFIALLRRIGQPLPNVKQPKSKL